MKLNQSGVYVLKRNGVPVYVGKSDNMASRIGSHKIQHDDVEVFAMSPAEAVEREKDLIRELKPKLNKNGYIDGGVPPSPKIRQVRLTSDNYKKVRDACSWHPLRPSIAAMVNAILKQWDKKDTFETISSDPLVNR